MLACSCSVGIATVSRLLQGRHAACATVHLLGSAAPLPFAREHDVACRVARGKQMLHDSKGLRQEMLCTTASNRLFS
jgi:hypothetical protein